MRQIGSPVACLAGTVHVGVTKRVDLTTLTIGLTLLMVNIVLVVVVVTGLGTTVFVLTMVVEGAYTVEAATVMFETTSMRVAVCYQLPEV